MKAIKRKRKPKLPTERVTLDAMRAHGFMFHHMPERDRHTMIFSRRKDARGRTTQKISPGVRVILTVPASGVLGRELVAAFKDIAKRDKRVERAKAKRKEARAARAAAKTTKDGYCV